MDRNLFSLGNYSDHQIKSLFFNILYSRTKILPNFSNKVEKSHFPMLCHDMICYEIICYDMICYVMIFFWPGRGPAGARPGQGRARGPGSGRANAQPRPRARTPRRGGGAFKACHSKNLFRDHFSRFFCIVRVGGKNNLLG